MPHQKELKPPAELVEATQNSEDGRAPGGSSPTGGIGATRAIGNRLMNETPQKPSQMRDPEAEDDRHGLPPDQFERRQLHLEQVKQQQKAEKYDRSHPGAGQAGRGDQAVNSKIGIERFARHDEHMQKY